MTNKPDITFEECRAAHVEMWDWLSKNPKAYKFEWPGWDTYRRMECFFGSNAYKSPLQRNRCFACYLAAERADRDAITYCEYCPIDWTASERGSHLYHRWEYEEDANERASLAEIIRDLPWDEGYASRSEYERTWGRRGDKC